MKEKASSGPWSEAGASDMPTATDMARIPHSTLPYPPPAALAQYTTNDGSFPPSQLSGGTFLNPTLIGIHHTTSSPGRAPLSASTSTLGGRRGSSNDSPHADPYHNSLTTSISDRRLSRQQDRYIRSSNHSPYDPEKASHNAQQSPPNSHRPGRTHSTYISEEEEDQKEHTVWILLYLSFFSPAVAALASMYTFLTIMLLLFCSPVTVFLRPRKPLKCQLHALLTPPIHYQLRLVFSTFDFELDHFKSEQDPDFATDSNPFFLTMINILSPVYATGIAVTAWVAAGFWFTALILGDPDGRDKKDDGRTVVLGVRRLWERWLIRGLR